jgi:phosphatidylinositol 4-phosphatase
VRTEGESTEKCVRLDLDRRLIGRPTNQDQDEDTTTGHTKPTPTPTTDLEANSRAHTMATTKPFVLHLFDDRVAVERADGSGAALVLARAVPDAPLEAYVDEKGKVLKEVAGGQLIPIDAIFGIYHLLSGPYLALVTDSEVAVSVAGLEFRRVTKAAIIPLIKSGVPLSEERQADEDRYLELLHAAISAHQFYFSYTHDVTQTLQRLATAARNPPPQQQQQPQAAASASSGGNGGKQQQAAAGAMPLWQRADDRFFWNKELVSELVAAKAHDWVVPMMNAFLDFRPNCSIGSVTAPGRRHRFHLLFVSRRSRHRQGCRFTMRGVDEEGHVANFVETEQALLHEDGRQTSFVQIRGSIPLFWASPVCMKVRGVAWRGVAWCGALDSSAVL